MAIETAQQAGMVSGELKNATNKFQYERSTNEKGAGAG
jgi:hypothetical protein